jgi:sulfide:quinone oxidoreductase
MVGQRTPGDLTRDLRRYRGNGVEVVRAEVTALDPTARTVETSAGALAADFLVLALGAELDPAGFPGLSQAGLTFYTAPGAVALRDHLARFGGGRVVILVSKIPFKCPAAPYEAALLIEAWMRRRGVREKVTVDLYTPEKLPMPVAGAAVGDALRELLAARGVGFHPEHALAAVDPASREVAFGNGATAFFDLLAYVPPHRAPAVVREAGLLNEAGWITVDPGTLETEHPGVYAIGDLAAARLRNGLFLPKAGVFAHAQALVVARNIAAQVAGRPPPARFDGRGYCWVEAGDGKAAFGSGDFYALPGPAIHLRGPSRLLHWGKVAFEKYWLWRWCGLRT